MGRSLERQPGGDGRPKIRAGYRHSPSERRLLDYIGPRGIPRSEFLGDDRESVTTYHYGSDGRLSHAVTVERSRWKRNDREAALEYQAEQDLICDCCGLPRDETMAEGSEYNATPVRCKAGEAIQTASRAFAGIEEPDLSAGIRWRVERAQED